MTEEEFEALIKRAEKAGKLGYEARSVIADLVRELTKARKPKPKAKAKKVAH